MVTGWAEPGCFFFQAEDGIRDKLVTGVQTCALPIYLKEIATTRRARSFFQSLQQTVEKCRSSWGKDWSVSIFSEAIYAGYKDEPQLEESVKDGRWSRAYVGEYDRTSQKLTLSPQDPKKMKSFQVVLP